MNVVRKSIATIDFCYRLGRKFVLFVRATLRVGAFFLPGMRSNGRCPKRAVANRQCFCSESSSSSLLISSSSVCSLALS